MKNLKLGTIGFGYRDWEGSFYPEGLPTREYLSFYSHLFNALELDTTFYGIPNAETVNRWVSDTDENFTFCLKSPRSITHEKGLIGTRGLMSEFCDSIKPFGNKLGVILLQLPPNFKSNRLGVLTSFLRELPDDNRFAIEFRHPSWYSNNTAELLSEHNVCWVITDYPGLPTDIIQTTDYLYIRWVGEHGSYPRHTQEQIDKSQQLSQWWTLLNPFLHSINKLYGFFGNDYTGFAPGACRKFMKISGMVSEADYLTD